MKVSILSEEGFHNWLRDQLEKREFMCGCHFGEEELKEQIYEILFVEQNMGTEDIERFFIPFGQAGYLSARLKFELMMYVLEKEKYPSSICFLGEITETGSIITEEDVEAVYMQWLQEDRLFLSEEEKIEFFIRTLVDRFSFGVMTLLQRLEQEGILLGEMCPPLYEGEPAEKRAAIYQGGKITRLQFLTMESREELIRIIRCVTTRGKKGELTVLEPLWDCVKENGTCITAVRPPAGKDWGIRILYGAGRRDREEW